MASDAEMDQLRKASGEHDVTIGFTKDGQLAAERGEYIANLGPGGSILHCGVTREQARELLALGATFEPPAKFRP